MNIPSRYTTRWETVVRLYRSVGILALVNDEVTPHGYAYGYGIVALGGDPPDRYDLGLHDLAHYLVAPRERRHLPNFGLGPHPSAAERGFLPRFVTRAQAISEEEAASLLNILIVCDLFGAQESERTMAMLGFPTDLDGDPDLPPMRSALERSGLIAPRELRLTLPGPLDRALRFERARVS